MNKKFVAIACLAAVVAISPSCKKDFLIEKDPNKISVDDSYKSPNDVLLAVNGIYQSLRSSNNVGESSDLWTDQRSDDTGTQDNQSNSGEPFQFGNFTILPSNTYLKSHWSSMYTTISRANSVLSHIDKVTFSDNNLKLRYAAEAKFLRAFIYFDIVRTWGDVPLVTEELTSADQVAAKTYREKQAIVYQQIIKDLTDVLASPLPNMQAPTGRTSKAAANFLLGQVYLTMATTQDQANRTANLQSAKAYLLAAYGMHTFGDLSTVPYTDVFAVGKKTTCPELIFQIVNIQGDQNYSSSIAANFQALGETINSRVKSAGAGYNVTHDLINEYETGDPRKDFSVKYATNTNIQDWFVTKFRDNSDGAGDFGYGGNDWILMRYADVILSLAEVSNYLGETSNAISYVDQVRTRAGMPTYAVSMTNSDYAAKYPTLKLAILHERRVELAFEHHRWFDLLRTFNDAELVAYFHAKNQSDFGLAKLANFTTKDRYFPIPFDENKLDPVKMYQNPGY